MLNPARIGARVVVAVGVVAGVDAQLVAVHGRVRFFKPVAAHERLVGKTLVNDELAHLGVEVLLVLGVAHGLVTAVLLAIERLGHLVEADIIVSDPNHKVAVCGSKRAHVSVLDWQVQTGR